MSIMLNVELIKFRESLGYSQAQFAKQLGIDRSSLCRLEQRKINPSIGTLLAIRKIVNKHSTYEYTIGQIMDEYFKPQLEIVQKSDII